MSKPRKQQNRKPKGRPISGWLILDKPLDFGSTEAVSKIKWLFNAQKAGHAGTLDPLASGMLPIALGDATKTVPYVMDGRKIYEFTVTWGEERATDDLEGEVVNSSDQRPDEQAIRDILPNYTGVIMQTPPQFSAIKIAGERAYDLAREGESRGARGEQRRDRTHFAQLEERGFSAGHRQYERPGRQIHHGLGRRECRRPDSRAGKFAAVQ